MRKLILILTILGTTLWLWGTGAQASEPALVRPAATSPCAYLQFINVYDPRIGRSYAVGGQAWCGNSAYEWRVVDGCARTLGGYPYLTVKGPWTHTYWSVEHCPIQYPYAQWISYERRLR